MYPEERACSFGLTNSGTLNTDWNCCLIPFLKIVSPWHHQSYANTVHFVFSVSVREISQGREPTLSLCPRLRETACGRLTEHAERACLKQSINSLRQTSQYVTQDLLLVCCDGFLKMLNEAPSYCSSQVVMYEIKTGSYPTDTGRITRSVRCQNQSPSFVWHHAHVIAQYWMQCCG